MPPPAVDPGPGAAEKSGGGGGLFAACPGPCAPSIGPGDRIPCTCESEPVAVGLVTAEPPCGGWYCASPPSGNGSIFPKGKCCMMGCLFSSSAWYILTMPWLTLDQEATPEMSLRRGDVSARFPRLTCDVHNYIPSCALNPLLVKQENV